MEVGSRGRIWRVVEHPRTGLIVAILLAAAGFFSTDVLRYVLLAVAVILILRSCWEWEQIQRHVSFRFASPIVRKEPIPKVVAAPTALGVLDFEQYVKKTSATSSALMARMNKEMDSNNPRLLKSAEKIKKAAGASVERRQRVARGTAKIIRKHARRFGRLQARYSVEMQAFLTNSRALLQAGLPDAAFRSVTTATPLMREASMAARTAVSSYRDSARATRSLNMSQAVNGASEDLIVVLDRVVRDIDNVVDYCNWVDGQAAARQSAGPMPQSPGGTSASDLRTDQ